MGLEIGDVTRAERAEAEVKRLRALLSATCSREEQARAERDKAQAAGQRLADGIAELERYILNGGIV